MKALQTIHIGFWFAFEYSQIKLNQTQQVWISHFLILGSQDGDSVQLHMMVSPINMSLAFEKVSTSNFLTLIYRALVFAVICKDFTLSWWEAHCSAGYLFYLFLVIGTRRTFISYTQEKPCVCIQQIHSSSMTEKTWKVV